MSEEMTKIFCSQCGSENVTGSKFCVNCGAKLEQIEVKTEENVVSAATEPAAEEAGSGVFSSEQVAPVYEKITDAEVVPPVSAASSEEININYGADNSSNSQPQYYSEPAQNEKQSNGNIGFAIASLICGILSLVCCCLSLFSMLLGIVAVVLGVITICCKYDGKGMAIAGIATGGVGICIWIIGLMVSGSSMYKEITNEIYSDLF